MPLNGGLRGECAVSWLWATLECRILLNIGTVWCSYVLVCAQIRRVVSSLGVSVLRGCSTGMGSLFTADGLPYVAGTSSLALSILATPSLMSAAALSQILQVEPPESDRALGPDDWPNGTNPAQQSGAVKPNVPDGGTRAAGKAYWAGKVHSRNRRSFKQVQAQQQQQQQLQHQQQQQQQQLQQQQQQPHVFYQAGVILSPGSAMSPGGASELWGGSATSGPGSPDLRAMVAPSNRKLSPLFHSRKAPVLVTPVFHGTPTLAPAFGEPAAYGASAPSSSSSSSLAILPPPGVGVGFVPLQASGRRREKERSTRYCKWRRSGGGGGKRRQRGEAVSPDRGGGGNSGDASGGVGSGSVGAGVDAVWGDDTGFCNVLGPVGALRRYAAMLVQVRYLCGVVEDYCIFDFGSTIAPTIRHCRQHSVIAHSCVCVHRRRLCVHGTVTCDRVIRCALWGGVGGGGVILVHNRLLFACCT